MSYRMILRTTGVVMVIEAALMVIMAVLALCFGENVMPFVWTLAILIVIGVPLTMIKHKQKFFFAREGYVTAALTWLVLSLFGALPFFFNGGFGNYINCFFEAVSGFTTTGSTILEEIETLPRAILLWRSTTHFVGGMGILVLATAIVPSGKDRAQHLMRAEMPGTTAGKLVPRLSKSSAILYYMYAALTLAEVITLLIAGTPLYDSVNIAFSTAGTGGFAVLNDSIAGYNAAVEIITSIYMLLFSVNFTVYFWLLTRKYSQIRKNQELWFFIGIVVVLTGAIAINIRNVYDSFGTGLRHAFFTVASTVSTTGFVVTDYDTLWPEISKVLILFLTFCGACGGSTGGGIKVSRLLILLKSVRHEINQIIHPRSVSVIRIDDSPADVGLIHSVLRFLAAYVLVLICGTILVSFNNFDFVTSFTSVLTCLGNVGPGLSRVGPVLNFNGLSWFSKIVLSLCMLIGRLEIFPILIFFSPATWSKK